jgi:catechol 2,3-dioxygenase-like lactoylglutathione lyase family enzyme
MAAVPGEMPNIVRSAYAELIVTDLTRSREFWVDLLGMVVHPAAKLLGERSHRVGYKEATPVLNLDGAAQPLIGSSLDESGVFVGADGFGSARPDYTLPADEY